MPVVNVDDLVRLQRRPEDIRNVSLCPSIHTLPVMSDPVIY